MNDSQQDAQADVNFIDDEYQRFSEYRESLERNAEGNQKEVVKLYQTFGTIFFAVSMAFIKDIVNLDAACWKGLMILSWLFFLMVIILSGLAGFVSSRTARGQFKFCDGYFRRHERMPDIEPRENEALANDKKLDKRNSIIRALNYGAAASFPLALLLLIVFIGLNI